MYGFLILAIIALAVHNPFGGYETTDVLYARVKFINHFREVYPEYSELSDDDLYAKALAKYPQLRTWIIEESDGSPVQAVPIQGSALNFRLRPPPAYRGGKPKTRSVNAFASWLDEPGELAGVIIPAALLAGLWIVFSRDRR